MSKVCEKYTQKESKQTKTSKPNQSKKAKRFSKSLTITRSVEHVAAPNEPFGQNKLQMKLERVVKAKW